MLRHYAYRLNDWSNDEYYTVMKAAYEIEAYGNR